MAIRSVLVMLATLAWLVLTPLTSLNVVQETPSVAYSTSFTVVLPLWDEYRAKSIRWVGVPAPEFCSAVAPLPEPMAGALTA